MTHAFPYLNLYLHPGPSPSLETHWLGFATGAEFRAGVRKAVELARQHHVTGWIADDRLLGAVHPRDLQWCFEEVLLALGGLGVRRFALLESQDALNRRTIDGMYQRVQSVVDFEIRRFTDLELARAWAGGAE
ncbi:hypothetical protein [Hymenobacter convexus]|uniref:hypothetical protein n=1 Tax=Hymenobacter sp. CA1UV-4 TaxID=3063782 RepID=UPI002713EC35|nr:hypothetical protein [Hymenobacter sp. CA1UV-4]MDO7851355.1 hypothetical protein [Hymenobacter sp. CA1UV-4]